MNDPRKGSSEGKDRGRESLGPWSPTGPNDPANTAPAAPSKGSDRPSGVLGYVGDGNTWVKLALAVASMSAYILAFIPPFTPEPTDIAMLAATPIVVFAWLFGFWGGTMSAIIIIPEKRKPPTSR